jgi:hypothetical protein
MKKNALLGSVLLGVAIVIGGYGIHSGNPEITRGAITPFTQGIAMFKEEESPKKNQ